MNTKEDICYLYKITNSVNDKIYIGSSRNIKVRLYEHKRLLNNLKHCNKHLQSSWIKHGKENFIFFVIELCDIKDLFSREDFYINKYNSRYEDFGYNFKSLSTFDYNSYYQNLTNGVKFNRSKVRMFKKRTSKTHCKRGHLYSEENTIIRKNGSRLCNECYLDYYKNRNTQEKLKRSKNNKKTCRNGHDESNKIINKNGKSICILCKNNSYIRNKKEKIVKGVSLFCSNGHRRTQESTQINIRGYSCKLCAKQNKKASRLRKKNV
jgi:group I intron endonuclease